MQDRRWQRSPSIPRLETVPVRRHTGRVITVDAQQLTTLGGLLTVLLALLGYLRVMKHDLRRDLRAEIIASEARTSVRFDAVDARFDAVDARFVEVEHRLTSRIDEVRTELTSKIDEVEDRLTTKIDEVKTDLVDRIDGVKTDLAGRIDGVDHRLDTIERRTYDIGRVLPPPAPPHAS